MKSYSKLGHLSLSLSLSLSLLKKTKKTKLNKQKTEKTKDGKLIVPSCCCWCWLLFLCCPSAAVAEVCTFLHFDFFLFQRKGTPPTKCCWLNCLHHEEVSDIKKCFLGTDCSCHSANFVCLLFFTTSRFVYSSSDRQASLVETFGGEICSVWQIQVSV